MKATRVSAAFAMITVAALLPGCMNIWEVDFRKSKETDLADWGGYSSWSLNDEPGFGLIVQENHITTSFGFPSDFRMELLMDIYADWLDTADFSIWAGDDDGESPTNKVVCDFKVAGDENNEAVEIEEDGIGLRNLPTKTSIPGFKKGKNTYRMSRTGDHVKITLNSAVIAEFDALYFDPAASFFSFETGEYSNVQVHFLKIEVSYEGALVMLP